MNNKIELTEQFDQPALSIRKITSVGNLPQEFQKAYAEIISYLNQIGEQPVLAFGAYHNLDMENLDVEMGFTLAKSIAGQGEIQSSKIPGGKQVSYLNKGPYAEMEPAYNNVTQWITQNGYVPTGISYEIYYNSPMEVPESELLTKIVFPVTTA